MSVLFAVLKDHWKAICIGGIIGILFAALLITRGTLAEVTAERDVASAKMIVSNASVARLQSALDRTLREQQDLAASDASRIKASRETLALIDAASEVREAARERLLASANIDRPEPAAECEVSEAVAAVWN